jgi:serine/threonine protein kinase
VAHIGVQVAEALEYAAGQGVLHRDVKPSNLLIDVWGAVWLTDFGLARASGAPGLTRSGDLVGTLRYMAPERFRGHADVRSDIYSLGLTLYELLALRPAFGEAAEAQLIGQITSEGPPRLDRLEPQLPRDLVTIVHKAMARDPADRYQTAGALAEDLRRFLDDRSILARRVRLPERSAPVEMRKELGRVELTGRAGWRPRLGKVGARRGPAMSLGLAVAHSVSGSGALHDALEQQVQL